MAANEAQEQFPHADYVSLIRWLEASTLNINFAAGNDKITDVVVAFIDNFDSLRALGALPASISDVARKHESASQHASLALFGRLNVSCASMNDETRRWFVDRANQFYQSIVTEALPPHETVPQMNAGFIDQCCQHIKDANLAVTSLYRSLIVNAWTMFETLARDLWIAAIDTEPKTIALLTGTEDRINGLLLRKLRAFSDEKKQQAPAKDKEEKGKNKKEEQNKSKTVANEGRSVTIDWLSRLSGENYNLGDAMGRVLQSKFDFTSLLTIRGAYSVAFSEKQQGPPPEKIDEALADPALDALSAMRNVLVHRAGKADDEYEGNAKRLKDCSPLPQLKENQRVELDGRLCAGLVAPAIKSCENLVHAVDSWITSTRKYHGITKKQ